MPDAPATHVISDGLSDAAKRVHELEQEVAVLRTALAAKHGPQAAPMLGPRHETDVSTLELLYNGNSHWARLVVASLNAKEATIEMERVLSTSVRVDAPNDLELLLNPQPRPHNAYPTVAMLRRRTVTIQLEVG
jgi:hypothetical protein